MNFPVYLWYISLNTHAALHAAASYFSHRTYDLFSEDLTPIVYELQKSLNHCTLYIAMWTVSSFTVRWFGTIVIAIGLRFNIHDYFYILCYKVCLLITSVNSMGYTVLIIITCTWALCNQIHPTLWKVNTRWKVWHKAYKCS